MKKTTVIIAGGGFAGISAAMYFDKTLARRDDVEVTLISRENFILFTPMLHEVAAGDLYPGDIVNPLRRILRHVKFVEGEVRRVTHAFHGHGPLADAWKIEKIGFRAESEKQMIELEVEREPGNA